MEQNQSSHGEGQKPSYGQRKGGVVLEVFPGPTFKIQLEDGSEILAYLSGRLRLHHIKVLPGDRVTVEMTPYDLKRGRIVYRG